MKLILRGHHLLCLKGFQGYGYSDDFVKNMTEINLKRKKPETIITLTNKADDICKFCPNLNNNYCMNESENEKIINMDNIVLKEFDFEKEYDSITLFEKVDKIFNSKKSVSNICLNCMWNEKCLFYQNLSKNR